MTIVCADIESKPKMLAEVGLAEVRGVDGVERQILIFDISWDALIAMNDLYLIAVESPNIQKEHVRSGDGTQIRTSAYRGSIDLSK